MFLHDQVFDSYSSLANFTEKFFQQNDGLLREGRARRHPARHQRRSRENLDRQMGLGHHGGRRHLHNGGVRNTELGRGRSEVQIDGSKLWIC